MSAMRNENSLVWTTAAQPQEMSELKPPKFHCDRVSKIVKIIQKSSRCLFLVMSEWVHSD